MKKFQNGLSIPVICFTVFLTFSLIGCDEGDIEPQTVTYTGVSGNTTYSLKITENTNRSVYKPQNGDSYQLTASGKISSGNVSLVYGETITLTPSNSETTFTATISGNNLTAMTGTITWNDNTTETAPSKLNPSGTGDENDNIEYNRFTFAGNTYDIPEAWMGNFGNDFSDSSVFIGLSFESDEFEIEFWMFVPNGNDRLVAGTYNATPIADDDVYLPFTFANGFAAFYNGEYYEEPEQYVEVSDGTIIVSVSGTGNDIVYTITIDCSVVDEDGNNAGLLKILYQGTPIWEDKE